MVSKISDLKYNPLFILLIFIFLINTNLFGQISKNNSVKTDTIVYKVDTIRHYIKIDTIVHRIDTIRRYIKYHTTVHKIDTIKRIVKFEKNGKVQKIDTIQSIAKLDTITPKIDSTKNHVKLNTSANKFNTDTVQQTNEVSALDIATNRGLFISSNDGKMQMRILGSVRVLLNYSSAQFVNQDAFNPYEIPMDTTSSSPNFYMNLGQSRLGFEVTRKNKQVGDIFVRIEADFNGINGNFRIRHAYGQINHLLVGQTWSIISNVGYQPATVNRASMPGAVNIRTPQIRYNNTVNDKIMWVAGIEYSTADLEIPDGVEGSVLQVIPDFSGRFTYKTKKFKGTVAAVLTTLSGRKDSDKISYSVGFGGLIMGIYDFNKNDKLYFTFGSGRGISHFFRDLTGKGQDAVIDQSKDKVKSLISTGGFVSYARSFKHNFSGSLSAGALSITNLKFQKETAFSYLSELMLDVFWTPLDGARVGAEIAHGKRVNNNAYKNRGLQFSMLIYYDF
jgi:hypothetical protein